MTTTIIQSCFGNGGNGTGRTFMHKLFPNPTNSSWIEKYNRLVSDVKSGKLTFESFTPIVVNGRKVGLGKHHIIPKSIAPELVKDPDNLVELPFKEHMDLHYFLWKADPAYARQLWFGCAFGRKHHLWDLPGGDAEYEELKKSLKSKRTIEHK